MVCFVAKVVPFVAKGGPVLLAKGGILLVAGIGILYLTIYNPFRRAETSSQNSAFSLRPILDNTSISSFHLRVISNNLPIHLRVCAKMFTLRFMPKGANNCSKKMLKGASNGFIGLVEGSRPPARQQFLRRVQTTAGRKAV